MSTANYSTNPDDNTAIGGIDISEGAPAGGFNDAFRQLMADVAGSPQRLVYGARAPVRTLRHARETLATLHTEVVGFAAHPNSGGAGITGGHGKTEYYVESADLDTSVANTFGWALASAKANGGGLIYFDPRGKFDIIITDTVQFRLNDGEDNITFYAPGMNVTVWTDPLAGTVIIKGANVLFHGIVFRTLAGPASGDFAGTGIKAEVGMVDVFPQNSNLLAFVNCEFRRPSDGACDIASTGFLSSSPECNVTFQNCIFWDADEVQLLGQTGTAAGTTSTEPRKLFVTHYGTIWAYCGQRQPKALGLAFCHMVNCYTLMQPWERDQPSPVASPGACAGAAVQGGGWLLAQGCLWQAADGIGGYNATNLVQNPTSLITGYLNVSGCAAEDGCVFETNGTVPLPTSYTLAATTLPGAGSGRDAWVAARWLAAGARPDAAPEGQFVWTDSVTAYPNGETVLIDRARTGRWLRVDSRDEYPATPTAGESSSMFATPRSYTRTTGFFEGKTTGVAIGATSLDLSALGSDYLSVSGNGGAANVRFLMSTSESGFSPGLHLYISGSSTAPITLKNSISVGATANASTDRLTVTGHGMTTGDWPIYFTTTGTLPAGMGLKVPYYAIVVDANTIQLALSYDDAVAGTAIDLTDAGTGTHTATIGDLNLPNGADLTLNSSAKVTELVYDESNLRFNVVARHYIQQTGTPAAATDLASAITLVNALRAGLISGGLFA